MLPTIVLTLFPSPNQVHPERLTWNQKNNPSFEQKQPQSSIPNLRFCCVPAVNFRHLRYGESIEQTWPHMLGSKAQGQRNVVTQAAFMKPWGPRSKPRRGVFQKKMGWEDFGKGTESRKSAGTNTLECKNVRFFATLCGCFCLICQLPIEIGTKWIVTG